MDELNGFDKASAWGEQQPQQPAPAGDSGPAKDAFDTAEAADDAFGADDDFDNFGDFGNDDGAGSDSFDDFGDFGDIDDSAAAPSSVAPAPAPGPGSTAMQISVVESVLVEAKELLMLNGLEGHGDRVQVIRKCLDLTFGDIETTAENMHARPQSPVIALDTAIKGGIPKTATNSTAGQATGEPRLLRNLLLIALSARLPDECWEHLLTPLSELRIEAIHSDEMAAEAAPLSIDEVRRIAAQLPDTGSGAADQQIAVLERALRSIDLLVSAKEKEVAKRRDEIDTYNQVIQTLVAQASKLH